MELSPSKLHQNVWKWQIPSPVGFSLEIVPTGLNFPVLAPATNYFKWLFLAQFDRVGELRSKRIAVHLEEFS